MDGEKGKKNMFLSVGKNILLSVGKTVLVFIFIAILCVRFAAYLSSKGRLDAIRGDLYYYGYGVAQDKAEAVKLYRKAAEQGDEAAKKALAKKYGIDEFRMEELIEEAFE